MFSSYHKITNRTGLQNKGIPVLKRFTPTTKPEDIAGDIEKLLVK